MKFPRLPWMSRKKAHALMDYHRTLLEERCRCYESRAGMQVKAARAEAHEMGLALQSKDRVLREIRQALELIFSKDRPEVPARPPSTNIKDAVGNLREEMGLGPDLTVAEPYDRNLP